MTQAPSSDVLLKWIRCDVPAESREAFSVAQESWSALADAAGFHGQIGGWAVSAPPCAAVVGLWSSRDAYDAFMHELHDEVIERSSQGGTYTGSAIAIVDCVEPMAGRAGDLADAAGAATFLRVAECALGPGRLDAFIETQRTVWKPGMQAAGMLGGGFGAIPGAARDRVLVASLWSGEAEHAAYVEGALPALKEAARVERDVEEIRGTLVRLEPRWRVRAIP